MTALHPFPALLVYGSAPEACYSRALNLAHSLQYVSPSEDDMDEDGYEEDEDEDEDDDGRSAPAPKPPQMVPRQVMQRHVDLIPGPTHECEDINVPQVQPKCHWQRVVCMHQ